QPELVGTLGAALVLLADHELAASTVAARVGASVRADPHAVASAGLAVLSGTLHGGASLGIEALLAEIDRPDRAASMIGARLRRGERLRRLGHPPHPGGATRSLRPPPLPGRPPAGCVPPRPSADAGRGVPAPGRGRGPVGGG